MNNILTMAKTRPLISISAAFGIVAAAAGFDYWIEKQIETGVNTAILTQIVEKKVATTSDIKNSIDALSFIPSGAVVAFDLEKGCPTGWGEFEPAGGRVLVGSGKYFEAEKNGMPSNIILAYRHMGGQLIPFNSIDINLRKILKDNFPSQKPMQREMPPELKDDGFFIHIPPFDPSSQRVWAEYNKKPTFTSTENIFLKFEKAPDIFFPPYIVTHYCKKEAG